MYGGEEGYEGEGGYDEEEEYEGEEGEIDLEGRVMLETAITRMDETSLELFYRVTNGLDHPILLTTPLPRVDADAIRPDPQRVYVYVDPEGVLQITKRLWPVPDDVEVVFPEVPFVTEVAAAGKFEERITIATPTQIDYPYRPTWHPTRENNDKETRTTGIEFSIAYMFHPGPQTATNPVPHRPRPAATKTILQSTNLSIRTPIKDSH